MGFKFSSVISWTLIFVMFLVTSSCATYNSKSIAFQTKLQEGDIDAAIASIEKNKFLLKGRNKLLYLLEKGKLSYLKGDYKTSNLLFNEADDLIESNATSTGNQILGTLLNPEKETYKGEDFEKVAIHYYKALNYAFLNQYDEALVEAKRINLQLLKFNEKYPKGKKNRYKDDAFAHNLQGLLYEASGDINNAFIAYRNAVDLYLQNNGTYMGVSVPDQLKQDVLRTASSMGFTDQVLRYEKKLNTKYKPLSKNNSEVVVFWENGLVPYKDQTFFTFTVLPGNNVGYVTVVNEELGIDLPLPINTGGDNKSDFSDLDVFNVAFPKYVSRNAFYNKASLELSGKSYDMQLVENYEAIAITTLKDRRFREIGKAALRLAAKKVSQYALKNQNEDLGALLGIFNAITEGADTRNWQSLPSHIYYSRLPLAKGENKVIFKSGNAEINQEIKVESRKGLQFKKVVTPKVYR
ncbi:COG3014 family protein [Aquimarina agarilytica]|uniref:COG3014 family protein n=1 Tax=Aquimarina agarilytica TaxID=1087449 RepID=UPI000289CDC9|nr:hypothetical protein [Aquimarina agarilytica]